MHTTIRTTALLTALAISLGGCSISGSTDGSYNGISARGANVHGDTLTVLVTDENRAFYLNLEAR